ncbi:toxin-antitoxin system, toxin component, RelE family [delta proteobacterium NaphS2]|nr:toxin-antitoxin system, toxin component, RelE family [delta proteobacterium NaphS2]
MPYSIELSKEAADDIDALYRSDRRLFNRIMKKMGSLEEHPYEGKPLVGNHKGEFSLRVGNYRIVYELDTANHILYVLTIKHRKHAY